MRGQPPRPEDPGGGDDGAVSDVSRDDRDVGWGERPPEGDPATARLLEDRPPHHDR